MLCASLKSSCQRFEAEEILIRKAEKVGELKESVDENPTREESGEQAKQLGKIHELNGRRELSEMDKKNRAEISRKEKFSAQNCYWQNEKWTLRAKRRKSRVNSSVDFDGKRVLQKKKKVMEFSRNYPLPPGRTTTAEHCQNQLTNLHEQKQSVSRTMLGKTNVYNLCVGMESPSQISIIASTRKKISENLSLPEQAQSSILPGWNLYYLSSPTKKWCEEITDRE